MKRSELVFRFPTAWQFAAFVGVLFVLTIVVVDGKEVKGSVPLDAWTFDKIMPFFKVALIKFDRVFAHGDKHDEFAKVAEAGHKNRDLLIAEINSADFAEKRNMDMHERYGINKDDVPVLKLFIRGKPVPLNYTGNFLADDIKRFIKSMGGVWIGLAACLEEYDELARLFTLEQDPAKQRALLAEAEGKVTDLKDDDEKRSAKMYIQTMKKLLEKGKDFIPGEIKRVEKLQTDKISNTKKEELKSRFNILHSFKEEL
ncbi:putative Endoplasmic reticulum resident protein 29 [Hypsibius exemplaris]|uniref:Endoplasmic reticulum resident protein 29 n=1 Tax=Hypsibius exemplaris TaxID=2072580 RepID=A0A1W0XEA2_HYPEX|nr:putative Endoplasmic reticulum resident protein 29 [Hypsibius exemplaris]